MLKFKKCVLSIFTTSLLTLSLSSSILANETVTQQPVNIQVDGVMVDVFDKQPFKENGTTYISLNDANKIFGDTGLTGEYIGIRDVAENLGYAVGWDSDDNSVILVNKEKLINSIGEFTVMNKILEGSNTFSNQNFTLNGEFSGRITLPDEKTGTVNPIDLDGITMYGLVSGLHGNNMEDASAKIDFSDISALSDDKQMLLSSLGQIDVNYKMNFNEGKLYFQVPKLQQLLNFSETAWFYLDINDLISKSGVNLDFVQFLNNTEYNDFKEVIKTKLNTFLFNDIESYNLLKTFFSSFNDGSFVKEDNIYFSEFNLNNDNTSLTVSLDITVDENDNFLNYYQSILTSIKDKIYSGIHTMYSADNYSDSSLEISIPGFSTYVFNSCGQLEPTNETPLPAPETSELIDAFQLLNGNTEINTITN